MIRVAGYADPTPISGPAPGARLSSPSAGPNQPENHQDRMANCKTIVAGELFQAARRPQARSARDGMGCRA